MKWNLLLIFILIISFTIFYYEYSFRCDEIINLAYVYIFSGTQCSVHREGLLSIRILSYPKCSKKWKWYSNTFVCLILIDKNTKKKIIHQVPYKFYLFVNRRSYLYVYKIKENIHYQDWIIYFLSNWKCFILLFEVELQ